MHNNRMETQNSVTGPVRLPHVAFWCRAGVTGGKLLSVCAVLLFLVNILYDIQVVDRRNIYIGVYAGELGFSTSLGRQLTGGSISSPSGVGVTRRVEPLRLGRARHRMHLWPSTLNVSHDFPLWLVFAFGIMLTLLSKVLLRSALYRRGKCIQCGYDLRGTPSARCSECGHPIGPPFTLTIPWLKSPGRKALAVYVVTALLWASCNEFYAFGTRFGWTDSGSLVGFVVQLCGPFGWFLAPYWPILDATHSGTLVAMILAVVLWTGWSGVLLLSRLRNAPLALHTALAIAWFCLGQFAVGYGVWFFAR